MASQILAAASGKDPGELYKMTFTLLIPLGMKRYPNFLIWTIKLGKYLATHIQILDFAGA